TAGAESTKTQGEDVGGLIGPARWVSGTAAGFHDFRRYPLDRPNLAGAAHCHGGARAAASGTAARHCEARIHVALAELPAHDDGSAHAPWPTRGRGIGRARNERQETAEGGHGRDSRPHRWGAAVHRGADQDGAGKRAVAGTGWPICSRTSAAVFGDPDDVARVADGAS